MSRGARRAVLRSLAPVAMMAAIFYLSAQPGGDPLAWWEIVLRKLGHFAGYAALALLWAWAVAPVVRRAWLPALAIAVLYAVSDEYHQGFVEGRRSTAVDVALDALGATAAALVVRQAEAARTEQFKDARRPAKGAHSNRP